MLKTGNLDRYSFPAHSVNSDYSYIRNFFNKNDINDAKNMMGILVPVDSPMFRNLDDVKENPINYEDDKPLISLLQTITRVNKYMSRGFKIKFV